MFPMLPANAARTRYLLRMRRVIAYIDRHLDGDLGLDVVSGLPPFHRTISTGSSARDLACLRYVQMARMKRAASQLAYRTDTVTDIAFDAGYEASDSFARAFRQRMGQAPLAFREQPDWVAWGEAMAPLSGQGAAS
jgi:AraC family transcriptional regulator